MSVGYSALIALVVKVMPVIVDGSTCRLVPKSGHC